jgi:hypothetical protein
MVVGNIMDIEQSLRFLAVCFVLLSLANAFLTSISGYQLTSSAHCRRGYFFCHSHKRNKNA